MKTLLKDIFDYLAKLSVALLVLIMIEGVATLGLAFDFTQYNWLGYLIQICLLIITLKFTSLDWNEKITHKPLN